MNSMESISTPEKQAPKQAPNGPVLRVFTKEGNGYTLRGETRDFDEAMKQAGDFHDKDGKDILVHEKYTPTVVHAKSNRSNDIDIGREIRPQEGPDGEAIKGAGERVLDSFYAKHPLDTKAFIEPQTIPERDQDKATAATPDLDKPTAPDAPNTSSATKDQAKSKASPEALDGPAPPKAIFNKTGYELPQKVLSAYKVVDGKFHDRDSNAVRFEDHGKKLSTTVEDPQVIAHMVDVAAAKNWGQLDLKGTETFKQLAWLEAQSRGIETKGYSPNEKDLEELAKLRQQRGTAEKQPAQPDPARTSPLKAQNEIAATVPRTLSLEDKMRIDIATRVMEKALAKLPADIRIDALTKMISAVEKGDLKLPAPKVTERAVDRPQPSPTPAMTRGR